ncbi:ATP-dependent sacrificial sulfur transferase LarE [Methanohalophilus profundi]|uniref:ATP-dependent sacrificial sulfur transferase LarE n=1 Tax=Methanohalophilus profundi TaxID=2138083 RepID=UPI001CDC7D1A|nr:ATP-dependent sacrificial sulfur transferase LarE [Methanohalophilus profundi]
MPDNKLKELERIIKDTGPMAILFSGGVDSSLLAVVARKVLVKDYICILLDSPLIPRSAVNSARKIADENSLEFHVLNFNPLKYQDILNNSKDRCYHCKKKIINTARKYASTLGFTIVADGTNVSDTHTLRPGLAACREEGIFHPFVSAGISKADIRQIARQEKYDFWDLPSSACLASRIPYGEMLDRGKLGKVEQGEDILHRRGFLQCRMRLHDGGTLARIEVPAEQIPKIVLKKDELVRQLKTTGITHVCLDLKGYRSGSMDET